MSQQTINLGGAPNDGTGDPARTAFGKCNSNFTELYATVVPNWVGLKSYAVGDVAIAPEGRLIVCNTAHTSALTYSCVYWTYPSPDDSALIDFTLLPNGLANTSKPTQGKVKHFGQISSSTQYSIVSGRFTETSAGSGTSPVYFPLDLPVPGDKVQHAWIEFDVSASPISNANLTILFSNYTGTDPTNIGTVAIHWSFYANVSGTLLGRWDAGGYNAPGVVKTTLVPINENNAGKQVRLDILIDIDQGKISGYYNGNLCIQYTEATIVPYLASRVQFEYYNGGAGGNGTYLVKRFGTSNKLPDFADSGTKKLSIKYGNDYSAVLGVALTTSWQKIYEFNVAFDTWGKVELTWFPRIDCTAGAVYIAAGIGGVAPSGYFVNNICEATTHCRVPYSEVVTSTANTVQSISIWAKTDGTATIQNTPYGDRMYGPSWRPTVFVSQMGVIT